LSDWSAVQSLSHSHSSHPLWRGNPAVLVEELIRKFAESSNETAGEHFTPRDIVQLTTSLVLAEKAIVSLDQEVQDHLVAALNSMDGDKVHGNREAFGKLLKKTLAEFDIEANPAELKALMGVLGERDPAADICKTKGKIEADSGLRDYENVPLGESIQEYFDREVRPHVPDAWIDVSKCDELDGEVEVVGFEIPFNRHFYVFQPPRLLEEIDRDLKACTDRIKQMIEELSA
jgi:type I restriction enzyme M protein